MKLLATIRDAIAGYLARAFAPLDPEVSHDFGVSGTSLTDLDEADPASDEDGPHSP